MMNFNFLKKLFFFFLILNFFVSSNELLSMRKGSKPISRHKHRKTRRHKKKHKRSGERQITQTYEIQIPEEPPEELSINLLDINWPDLITDMKNVLSIDEHEEQPEQLATKLVVCINNFLKNVFVNSDKRIKIYTISEIEHKLSQLYETEQGNGYNFDEFVRKLKDQNLAFLEVINQFKQNFYRLDFMKAVVPKTFKGELDKLGIMDYNTMNQAYQSKFIQNIFLYNPEGIMQKIIDYNLGLEWQYLDFLFSFYYMTYTSFYEANNLSIDENRNKFEIKLSLAVTLKTHVEILFTEDFSAKSIKIVSPKASQKSNEATSFIPKLIESFGVLVSVILNSFEDFYIKNVFTVQGKSDLKNDFENWLSSFFELANGDDEQKVKLIGNLVISLKAAHTSFINDVNEMILSLFNFFNVNDKSYPTVSRLLFFIIRNNTENKISEFLRDKYYRNIFTVFDEINFNTSNEIKYSAYKFLARDFNRKSSTVANNAKDWLYKLVDFIVYGTLLSKPLFEGQTLGYPFNINYNNLSTDQNLVIIPNFVGVDNIVCRKGINYNLSGEEGIDNLPLNQLTLEGLGFEKAFKKLVDRMPQVQEEPQEVVPEVPKTIRRVPSKPLRPGQEYIWKNGINLIQNNQNFFDVWKTENLRSFEEFYPLVLDLEEKINKILSGSEVIDVENNLDDVNHEYAKEFYKLDEKYAEPLKNIIGESLNKKISYLRKLESDYTYNADWHWEPSKKVVITYQEPPQRRVRSREPEKKSTFTHEEEIASEDLSETEDEKRIERHRKRIHRGRRRVHKERGKTSAKKTPARRKKEETIEVKEPKKKRHHGRKKISKEKEKPPVKRQILRRRQTERTIAASDSDGEKQKRRRDVVKEVRRERKKAPVKKKTHRRKKKETLEEEMPEESSIEQDIGRSVKIISEKELMEKFLKGHKEIKKEQKKEKQLRKRPYRRKKVQEEKKQTPATYKTHRRRKKKDKKKVDVKQKAHGKKRRQTERTIAASDSEGEKERLKPISFLDEIRAIDFGKQSIGEKEGFETEFGDLERKSGESRFEKLKRKQELEQTPKRLTKELEQRTKKHRHHRHKKIRTRKRKKRTHRLTDEEFLNKLPEDKKEIFNNFQRKLDIALGRHHEEKVFEIIGIQDEVGELPYTSEEDKRFKDIIKKKLADALSEILKD